MKKTFQAISFNHTYEDFCSIGLYDDFDTAVKECIRVINDDVDISNTHEGSKFDHVTEDEIREVFIDDRTYTFEGVSYGIIDITDYYSVSYEDYVLMVRHCKLDEDDIKAIKIPFESMEFLKSYLKRVIGVFGGEYIVLSIDEFDRLFDTDVRSFSPDYTIHIKVGGKA